MNKRARAAAAVAVLALGAGAAWWFDAPARLGFGGNGIERVHLYGNVDIRQVDLGFRIPGRIAEMRFEEGDQVPAGEVLARLDPRQYEDARKAAEAEFAGRQAALQKLRAGERPAQIEQARAIVAEREADLLNARQSFERARKLVDSAVVSRASFEDAEAATAVAEARLASARSALQLLLEGFRQEDIAAGQAAADAAAANLGAANTALADTELRAPHAGMVLTRAREPGAIVSSADTVYSLSLSEPVWVRAYIAEPMLGRIHPGMKVEVMTDSAPTKPYQGQIGFISPVAEFTPKAVETPELRTDLVYRLRILIENGDDGLRQGMPVTVRLPEQPVPS